MSSAKDIGDAGRGSAKSTKSSTKSIKSIGEALREIVPRFAPTESVSIPLLSARGLVLAQDVIAGLDLPGFDHSAMDGYAVRHQELSGGDLPVRGESRAGGDLPSALPPGHAMRIFTGAPLPDGADTVVIQEDVSRLDGPDGAARIVVQEAPTLGSNIRRRGSDLAQGKCALRQGQRIGPGEIGLLAALNCATVAVHRKPRVAILCTGDELLELGAAPALLMNTGKLINSNAYMLVAQVEDAGCEALLMPRAVDAIEAITQSVESALSSADAVLTTGGVSVGDHDLVAEALSRAGVTTHFWKVAMKPGKPLLFGSRGRVPVLGLPGNPVSAFVGFEVFVRPALAAMQGHAKPYSRLFEVTLDHDHRKSKGRPELVRGQLIHAADGVIRTRLHARQGSGSVPSIAAVDALILLPGEQTEISAGSALKALAIGARPECAEAGFE